MSDLRYLILFLLVYYISLVLRQGLTVSWLVWNWFLLKVQLTLWICSRKTVINICIITSSQPLCIPISHFHSAVLDLLLVASSGRSTWSALSSTSFPSFTSTLFSSSLLVTKSFQEEPLSQLWKVLGLYILAMKFVFIVGKEQGFLGTMTGSVHGPCSWAPVSEMP